MQNFSLTALSPLDGRYAEQVAELAPIFSEFGFVKFRLAMEIRWLKSLASEPTIIEVAPLSAAAAKFLDDILENFSLEDMLRIKEIEKEIIHDSKALEYFLKEKMALHKELKDKIEFVHFACTSDDITNLAYALMLKETRDQHLLPQISTLITKLKDLAHAWAEQPLLGRTHGQPASPTTVGKEIANFVSRLEYIRKRLLNVPLFGKANGAVGNFNAHVIAYPEVDWLNFSKKFVTDLGLEYNAYTTQIEPHDALGEFCDALVRFNLILVDLARDVWGYVAIGCFYQKVVAGAVGSSVMPHKVNPINFENAEGNLGLANALLRHFSEKLVISRWQRDLSDSTVLRNLGSAFGYSLLAYKSLQQGLDKLILNTDKLNTELLAHWEILTEAVQTVMRRFSVANAYEQLKKLSRGQVITAEVLHQFIKGLAIPQEAKERLLKLTPLTYLGMAVKLAKEI